MDTQTTNSILGEDIQPLYTPTSDEKTMAILSHILTLVCGFIAPLIIYLIKKDESKFVAEHARESLNFQITLFIIMLILLRPDLCHHWYFVDLVRGHCRTRAGHHCYYPGE